MIGSTWEPGSWTDMAWHIDSWADAIALGNLWTGTPSAPSVDGNLYTDQQPAPTTGGNLWQPGAAPAPEGNLWE